MEPDTESPEAEEPEAKPRYGAGVIAGIFVLNLAILAYAVRATRPAEASPRESAAVDVEEGLPGLERFKTGTVTKLDLPADEIVQQAFVRHCSACHGKEGRGDGPAAARLLPQPRDFVDSPLRFAARGSSRAEILQGIERAIAQGVPRSAMPGFRHVLEDRLIAGLARYVVRLREAQGGELTPAAPVELGERPPPTEDLLARGRSLYVSLGCVNCHGDGGRGDGPGAVGLVDSLGRPIRPADYTSGLFKSGQDEESIARTIAKGVPGTPMIAYEASLLKETEDGRRDATDLWALAYFVRSFREPGEEHGVPSGAEVRAAAAPVEAMLEDPAHPAWIGVPHRLLEVKPLWQRHEETTFVNVRAVQTASRIGVCLEWRDDTFDVERGMGRFPDGAAVMFSTADEVPALPMGVQVEEESDAAPVNIWHWRADLQFARGRKIPPWLLENGSRSHAGVEILGGPPPATPLTTAAPPGLSFDGAAQERAYLSAAAVGNLLSAAIDLGKTALDANAVGFGTLSLQPMEEQDLEASALWSQGTWRVVISRDLEPESPMDAAVTGRERIPIAAALWNGAHGDHGGVKLITGWHWLVPLR